MKPVSRILIKEGSDFWKHMQKEAELDAEKAAAHAAEKARKEALERAARIAAEQKAYHDSIRHYDDLVFRNEDVRNQIAACVWRRSEISKQLSAEYEKQDKLRKELQSKCLHDEVIERQTSWKDEYDDWHSGNYERKCIECFLIEESSYTVDHRSYSIGQKQYKLLAKSQVVLLRRTIDGKEYELEFDDLKW